MIEKRIRDYLIFRVEKTSVIKENGCVEWTGTKNNAGYGLIRFSMQRGDSYKPSIPVSRAHYMAYHNIILERHQHVCHKCDNRACVNIKHLFLGSSKDNMQDCIAKGRKAKTHAYHHRERKFTNEQIEEIRKAPGTLREVCEKYGISNPYLSKLRRNLQKRK